MGPGAQRPQSPHVDRAATAEKTQRRLRDPFIHRTPLGLVV